MQAAVLDGPAQPFQVREVDLDEPRAGEALVRIAATGLCGSDLEALDGLRTLAPFPAILGATDTIDASAEHDPAGTVRKATDGGADYAFEAAGRGESIEQAWASLANRGLLTVIGTLPSGTRITLDADPLIEEKRLAGCYLGAASPGRDVPALVERYHNGELRLDELVSRRIALTELDEGFARLRDGAEARQVVVFTHREEWHVN